MKKTTNVTALCAVAAIVAATATAQDRDKPRTIPHQDHVFVIVMENHGYQQIINNPNEPFLNSLIAQGKVSLSKNYFAIGHPSLTNYLEIVGRGAHRNRCRVPDRRRWDRWRDARRGYLERDRTRRVQLPGER